MVGTGFGMLSRVGMMKPVVTVEFIVLKKNMETLRRGRGSERKTFVTTFF